MSDFHKRMVAVKPVWNRPGIAEGRVGQSDWNRSAKGLEASGDGMQVLKIIYTPPRGADGWLHLKDFGLRGIPERFTTCEDTKVCLAELWETSEGRQIRNSNRYQYQCLFEEGSFMNATDSFRNVTDVRKQMYAEIPRMHTGSGCTDTVGWKSPAKHTCSEYETKFKWCKNGKAMPNQEWTVGKRWGYPERHCCACGRLAGQSSPWPTASRPV